MIKLKSLIETRVISPEESLLVGDITLYHGTTYPIALLAKKGELGPVKPGIYAMDILMRHFGETLESAKEIVKKHIGSRRTDPPRLFLTTRKETAEGYARSATKYGGECVMDILSPYLANKRIPPLEARRHLLTDDPAVVTFTVPLSIVLTHPHWATPARKRILDIVRNIRKMSKVEWDWDRFSIEVFVAEKIPSKYLQRIDRIPKNDILS